MSWDFLNDPIIYTHLLATISECQGSFRVLFELRASDGDIVCTEETASSIGLASALVAAVANNFSIERANVRIEIDRGGARVH
jgi:hypothetical protein